MIVQCPSCQSRFSVDASQVKSPLSKGHCSVCGHVFTLLDHALESMETAALRDRFEREREEKLKNIIGKTGVYGHPIPSHEEKTTPEVSSTSEPELSGEIPVPPSESPESPEEAQQPPLEVPELEGVSIMEGETPLPAEEESLPKEETPPSIEEEVSRPEAPEPEEREGEEEGFEAPEEEEEIPAVPELEEDLEEPPAEAGREDRETEIDISKEPESPESEPIQGEVAPPREEEPEPEPEQETGTPPPAEPEPATMEEELEPFERPKRSPFLPILIVILILVVLGGGGWYLYQSGALTSNSLTGGIIKKINEIRGKSTLVLFNLKNEQEPATDGKFFAVRGMIQNTQKATVPFVQLKIKIFDAKGKVILTGQTYAGKVLKAEQISKMTVHNVLNTYHALNRQNRKTAGRLAPGAKLPFLFLFDLSKFPRNTAKSFQVEIVNAP